MDTQLFILINRGMANPLFDAVMPFLSSRGYLFVIPFVLSVLYYGIRHRQPSGRAHLLAAIAAIVIAAAAFPLSNSLSHALKDLFAAPRPCHVLEGVRLLVPCPDSYAMPSGHAVTSFAYATPLFLLTRPFLPLAARLYPLLLAAVVAFSRPYLGVHYPSDILAGAVFGAAFSTVACLLFRWIVPGERDSV